MNKLGRRYLKSYKRKQNLGVLRKPPHLFQRYLSLHDKLYNTGQISNCKHQTEVQKRKKLALHTVERMEEVIKIFLSKPTDYLGRTF